VSSTPSSHVSDNSYIFIADPFINYPDRRSQYLAAGNPVVSGVQNTIYDEESGLLTDEGDDPLNGGDLTPRQGISANDVESPASCADLLGPLTRQTSPIRTITASTFNNFDKPCEGTPLLHRAVSFSSAPHPRRISTTQEFPIPRGSATSAEPASYQSTVQAQPTQCQSYSGSVKSTGHEHGGKSTFGQSVSYSYLIHVLPHLWN
jgi:hypothetical protein